MVRATRRAAVAAAAACVALAVAVPAGAQEGSASVVVAHFSPDAPDVDIYLDGDAALTGVPYGVTSDPLTIPAGPHDIDVRPAGAGAGSDPVLSASVELEAGTAYTVAAVGLLEDIAAQIWVGADMRPGEGTAGVRAIHAAPEVGPVDVALADGTVVLSDLSFPNASEYLDLDPGEYDLDVRAAGSEEALLSITASVEGNMLYSVVAIGGGGQDPELIALVDEAGSDVPSVRGVATGEGGTASGDLTRWIVLGIVAIMISAFVLRRRVLIDRR